VLPVFGVLDVGPKLKPVPVLAVPAAPPALPNKLLPVPPELFAPALPNRPPDDGADVPAEPNKPPEDWPDVPGGWPNVKDMMCYTRLQPRQTMEAEGGRKVAEVKGAKLGSVGSSTVLHTRRLCISIVEVGREASSYGMVFRGRKVVRG